MRPKPVVNNAMKLLEKITGQYPSYYAAGKDLNVNAQQLKRLVDKGAIVDESGKIYIPSQTVIDIKKAASKCG